MTERDYPELRVCSCEECGVCFHNGEYFDMSPFQNEGIYDSIENIVYLTNCARFSPFKKTINTINHEYLHWVIHKLFPGEKYIGEYVDDIYAGIQEKEYDFTHILDTYLWKSVEISLGHRYKDVRNRRWAPLKVDVWDGMIATAFDRMDLVDARELFK